MRVLSVARPLTLAFAATALIAGCAAQSATGPAPSSAQAMPPVTVPFAHSVSPDAGAKVGVRLTGEQPFNSKHYGQVLGYFKGKTSTTSEVVVLSPNIAVTFFNVDTSRPHTASFLGDATKKSAPWPSSFNGSSTKSPAGTDIGTTDWSTGSLSPGTKSASYNTGAPGFYMIGCAFHYDSNGMRTVIIVK